MKDFRTVVFDRAACLTQLAEFKTLLEEGPTLAEDRDIRPFFNQREQLSVLLGSLNPDIIACDRLAYEFDLFGDFACDVVVGDSANRADSFIEFEDGGPSSIFVRKGRKTTPEWSPRFEHGYSQVIDWFWKLDAMERTDDFRYRFGAGPIQYNALLIIGRENTFGEREEHRLSWRTARVVVNSKHVNCFTFDKLYESLKLRIHHAIAWPI